MGRALGSGLAVVFLKRENHESITKTREGGRMQNLNYHCPKCGHTQYEVDEFRATGSFLAKMFDVQNKKFSTVTCSQCKYTEMYRADSSMLGNIFDFFAGG